MQDGTHPRESDGRSSIVIDPRRPARKLHRMRSSLGGKLAMPEFRSEFKPDPR
jgi:hypothetical protein